MASLICFDIDCSMQNLACRLELANASAKGQHAANLRGSSLLFSFPFVFFFNLFVCLLCKENRLFFIPKAQKEKETVILGVVLQPIT